METIKKYRYLIILILSTLNLHCHSADSRGPASVALDTEGTPPVFNPIPEVLQKAIDNVKATIPSPTIIPMRIADPVKPVETPSPDSIATPPTTPAQTNPTVQAQTNQTEVKDQEEDPDDEDIKVTDDDLVDLKVIENPVLTATEKAEILSRYPVVNSKHELSAVALRQALYFFDTNKDKFHNHTYITIIDMTQPSTEKRMYIVDLQKSQIKSYLVAHGKGSDRQRSGLPTQFSNKPNSLQTSIGFYITGETYMGKYGSSLKLDGVSETNYLARKRNIVMHPAPYVGPNGVGRSFGCPAVEPGKLPEILPKVRNKSLFYIWAGEEWP